MADNAAEAARLRTRRLKAASLFAICLITLTALLELGLAAHPMI